MKSAWKNRKPTVFSRSSLVGLVFVLGSLLTLFLYLQMRWGEDELLKTEFKREASNRAQAIQECVENNLEVVESLGAFYRSNHEVEPGEFRTFSASALQRHPEIAALEWAPRVKDSDLQAFKETTRQAGLTDFQVRDLSPDLRLIPAADREEYFPVLYSEPSDKNKNAQGFDHSSVKERAEAMELARDIGKPVSVFSVTLWQVPGTLNERSGLAIFLPIYRNGVSLETLKDRREGLAGFVIGVYRIEGLIEGALKNMDLDSRRIRLCLYNGLSRENDRRVYQQPLLPGKPPPLRLEGSFPVKVVEQQWLLTAQANPEFFVSRQRSSWVGLLLALLSTLLLCGTFYNISSSTSIIETVVAQKTEELTREIQERKEAEVKSQSSASTLHQKTLELSVTNAELAKRGEVMRSLLEDLGESRSRLQDQASKLQETNRKLEKMGALKDEFVAKVSHELRTPLTSVKEGLNLMLDGALGPATPEQKDFLATMDGDIDRLSELINNMLDISKIEAGRMRLQRRRVGMASLIRATVKSYRAIRGDRTIEEKLGPAPDVFVDSNRILQVLGNLFSNAMKYGDPHGRITFSLVGRDGQVVLTVEDEGQGILPKDLPKLFQKFSQVGPQQAGRLRGTGLGLVICKEFVELHGGKIEVESQVGKGTRFTVSLPVYTDERALRDSFLDLKHHESEKGIEGVGLIAVETSAVLDTTASKRREELERQAEKIRQRLHQGDVVLWFEPSWVVILAATDDQGIRAIIQRLQQALQEGGRVRFGAAVEPMHGVDALTLFNHAKRTLDQGLASGIDARAMP